MTKRLVSCVLGAGMAITLSAGMAAAKSGTVNFDHAARLGNGPTINAGEYRVTVMNQSSNPEVDFYQGGKQVAEVPVTLVSVPKKNSETEVIYDQSDSSVVTEIDLNGWNQKIVFSPNASR